MDRHVKFTKPNGEIITKHIRAQSEEEFKKKIAEIQNELDKKPLLSYVVDEWDNVHSEEINYNTQQSYIAPIKNIKAHFKGVRIDEIRPLDIDLFLKKIFHDNQWSRQTIKLRLIVLNQVFNYAIIQGYTKENPCIAVKVPSKATAKKGKLPNQNYIEIVKDSVNDDFGLFPFLLLYTGCRRGEALALTYEDIDWENKIIYINKTVIFVDGKPIIQHHTKTASGDRTIPLLPPLEKKLEKHGKGYIFTFEGNLPNKSRFFMLWKKYTKTHDIKLTPHQLRHAYATILYEAGVKTKEAQMLLGHASSEITQEIYTHISEAQKSKTFNKLINYVQ